MWPLFNQKARKMGLFLEQLGQAAANTAANAGNGILGAIFGGINDRRQIKQQRRLNELQKEMTDWNMGKQLEMWEATGYGAQKEQMKRAGINPALMYGGTGAGGTTNVSTSSGSAATGHSGEIQAMLGMGMQRELLKAQKENIEADTANKQAQAAKTAGVDTENVKADTENKILAKVITDFTGREAKDTYEKVKSPNRSIEAKTMQDELEARQGVAGTIYELWKEGKLKDKSVAEIESILLSNSKSRAETANIYRQGQILEENLRGAKMDNVIKDLEMRLQKETGIDRNSPAWMKIIGRLFVELFNK